MTKKKCFKCGVKKLPDEFYRHPATSDGRLGKCKECSKKDVKENRAKNIEYYLEYDRKRANDEKRVLARKLYSTTPSGIKSHSRARIKYRDNNKIKSAAHILVGNAVRDGKLKKASQCETCGEKNNRLHGHHDNYSMPLSVRWLCHKCHKDWHKENGPGTMF